MVPLIHFKSPLVNNLHVHTPYSFSYFSSIAKLINQAAKEGIRVLGINDFYSMEGYFEFTSLCRKENIFPVYGLEVMALRPEDKRKGILWNDPHNPGRIYLCGKGFLYPPQPDKWTVSVLNRIREASQIRIREMIHKLNLELKRKHLPFLLSYDEIRETTPSGWVRERHIAKTLLKKIEDLENSDKVLEILTGEEKSEFCNNSSLYQKLLRDNLLKAGGVAYVEEREDAFLSIEEAKKLFLALEGMPVYPVLADGGRELTYWEEDPSRLARNLKRLGFFVAEFIPHRNKLSVLTEYVHCLHKEGLVITAGSEHNTPENLPLRPVTKDSAHLSKELLKIFWEGCCIVVAHQYLKSIKEEGFVDELGNRTNRSKEELKEIGEERIDLYQRHRVSIIE